MTSDGEVLLHGYAVKCDAAPSKTIRNPKVLSPIFADPWSRKMRSPNSSARSPLREIFLALVLLSCRMDMSSPHVDRGHRISRNVQVSCPLHELRGGHLVVFQVKILQVPLVLQLVDNVSESFNF